MDRMSGCVHISVDPENKSLIYLYFADDAAQTNCMRLLRDNKKYGTCWLVRVEFCPAPYLCMIAISQIGTDQRFYVCFNYPFPICKLEEAEKHNKLHSWITRCCALQIPALCGMIIVLTGAIYLSLELQAKFKEKFWLLPFNSLMATPCCYFEAPWVRVKVQSTRLGCGALTWWCTAEWSITYYMTIWKSVITKGTDLILKGLLNMFRACQTHIVFPTFFPHQLCWK